MKRYLFALWLLWFTTPTHAQDADGYAARSMSEGTPRFPSFSAGRIANPISADIPVPDSAQTITVVWGTRDGQPSPWLLHARTKGSVTVSGLEVDKLSDGLYETRTEIVFEPGLSGSTPLSLYVLPEEKLLLYRWPGASTIPGGQPTPVVRPMDAGTVLPELALKTLDGEPFGISRSDGSFKFLVYWDPGCSAFLGDRPSLDSLARAHSAQHPSVDFVAIALDADIAKEYVAEHPFAFTHAFASDGAIETLGTSFPRYTIVSPEGKVLYDATGGGAGNLMRMGQVLNTLVR